jgi:hypothetical protein
MSSGRKPEIILKTDEMDIRLELERDGKFAAKSTGWDEKRVYFEGDKLEIAVVRGRWVLTRVPAGPKPAAAPVEHYFPTE